VCTGKWSNPGFGGQIWGPEVKFRVRRSNSGSEGSKVTILRSRGSEMTDFGGSKLLRPTLDGFSQKGVKKSPCEARSRGIWFCQSRSWRGVEKRSF